MTGATGKAGRAAVRELREHGYDVVATDAVVGPGESRGATARADLTDYGEATEVLRGADAVVHLANIPAPGMATPAVTFNANITMNFNVFHAAAALGMSPSSARCWRSTAPGTCSVTSPPTPGATT